MKAISPLVAVIMLVAFVLVVAGLVFSWLSNFVTTQREEFQFCSKAGITVQKAYYNEETNNINIVVYNTGKVPLTGFTLLVTYKGNKLNTVKYPDKIIEAKDIGLFAVPYEEGVTDIVIQSLQCRGAQDMILIYDVEGIENAK